ncbi:MAG: RagB/SusD family nutrient uptake outer membrane protein [Gemmatimonadetes bacterium]|nr:RagB/SusD family nutrient uptake outer membrane protein [Gemmatimonadota bacterium]
MKTRLSLRRATLLGVLGAAGIALAACDSDLLTEKPKDVLVGENLYTSASGFRNGLNGLYAEARRERSGFLDAGNNLRGMMYFIGVDNGWGNYRSPAIDVYNLFGTLNNSQEDDFLDVWKWLYETINAANTIVDRAENPEVKWTEAEKNETLAEARFFRAWAYRHLSYLWGGVPLALHESSGANIKTDWERATRQQVWDQVEQDLLFAEQYLPDQPTTQGGLTKAVAQHYLAELYLAEDQPVKAEVYARKVTDSGRYRLITARYGVNASAPGVAFMDQFADGNVNRNQRNTEGLWVLQYQNNVTGGGSNIMRRYWVARYYAIAGMKSVPEFGGRGIGRLAPTRWALELYAPTDDRGSMYAIRKFYQYNNAAAVPKGKKLGDTVFTKAVKEDTKGLPDWPSTRKWDYADPLDPDGGYNYEDQPYVRLAETYLLLAEAQFKQGNTGGAAATINLLRDRAHAPRVTAAQVTLDLVLDERSRELLAEEQRRYTLLRTHTWLDRTKKYNPIAGPNVTARDTVFPIPQAVIDANLTKPMPQNPGY